MAPGLFLCNSTSVIEHYNMASIDIPYMDINKSPITYDIIKNNNVGTIGEFKSFLYASAVVIIM